MKVIHSYDYEVMYYAKHKSPKEVVQFLWEYVYGNDIKDINYHDALLGVIDILSNILTEKQMYRVYAHFFVEYNEEQQDNITIAMINYFVSELKLLRLREKVYNGDTYKLVDYYNIMKDSKVYSVDDYEKQFCITKEN